MFKSSPLENEDDLRIMFGPIVCTNETTLVYRVEDANSLSNGREEDILAAVFHDSSKPRKKKEPRDDYTRRIVDAFESRTFSLNKTISSYENDPMRKEVAAQLQQVIEDAAKEGSNLHFFATQLLIDKHH
jgi:hypothetical protein